MAGRRQMTARQAASIALREIDIKKSQSSAVLNRVLGKTAERQRATDLVLGTIRNRMTIDRLIETLGNCTMKRVSSRLIHILRIGVYELVYCPATGEHAIVNEAVELAKKVSGQKASAFVNAILRHIGRAIVDRHADIKTADRQTIIFQQADKGCLFNQPILPNPEKHMTDYLSAAFSLPRWLVESWLDEYGYKKAFDICVGSNRRPSVYLHTNTVQITAETLAERLKKTRTDCRVTKGRSVQLRSPKKVNDLWGYRQGYFTVQDITASKAAEALDIKPKMRILDMCSAPGTKSCQMAILAEDNAEIVATDIDPRRLELVKQNAARLGLKGITVVRYEHLKDHIADGFDRILLDVPCSNTGVLAKRCEVRFRLSQSGIQRLCDTQAEILDNAADLLKSGGLMCYSTCSICVQENARQVQEFLERHNDFVLLTQELTLPSAADADHDGGYFAILTKK